MNDNGCIYSEESYSPQFLAFYLEWHGYIVFKQLSSAQALIHLYVRSVDIGSKLSHCVQTYITFQCTCHPRSYATCFCQLNPFACAVYASMQRRLKYDVLRLYTVQQVLFH